MRYHYILILSFYFITCILWSVDCWYSCNSVFKIRLCCQDLLFLHIHIKPAPNYTIFSSIAPPVLFYTATPTQHRLRPATVIFIEIEFCTRHIPLLCCKSIYHAYYFLFEISMFPPSILPTVLPYHPHSWDITKLENVSLTSTASNLSFQSLQPHTMINIILFLHHCSIFLSIHHTRIVFSSFHRY